MSYFNEVLIKFCFISRNLINENVFLLKGSRVIRISSIIYENNNFAINSTNFNQGGGFLKTLFCPQRIFSNINILDSNSEKTTIGIKIIDQNLLQYSSPDEFIIKIENSIFFNNIVVCFIFDKEYGVVFYMDTYITTNISNIFLFVKHL